MDEDRLNMAIRKFLKEVGLRLRMSLTSEDAPSLQHVVEATIDLR